MRRGIFFLLLLVLWLPAAGAWASVIPNDTLLSYQQWYLEKVRAFEAWDRTQGTPEVVVAVIDTGADLDHPDLAANLWMNLKEIPGDGVDNDANGYVDDLHGWNFVENNATPSPNPADGFEDAGLLSHGTAVSGILAAVGNNGEGIAGIAWRVRLMQLRAFSNAGESNTAWLNDALRYAIANGARIINISATGVREGEGATSTDLVLERLLKEAYDQGIVVVSSVGNTSNGGLDMNATPTFPACVASPTPEEDWIIGVAATDQEDAKALFSNFGRACTDLSAPGVQVATTVFYDPTLESLQGSYQRGWSGTSVATPFVTGTVALLRSLYPALSPSQIKTVLQLSADPVNDRGTPYQGQLGAGRLNIARALLMAGSVSASPSVAPVPAPVSSPVPVSGGNDLLSFIAAAGDEGEPRVVIYDRQGKEHSSFLAYGKTFSGGVRVAMGDLDGDREPEIVTVPRKGGGPHVRLFHTDGTFASDFFAFEKTSRTGLRVAVGDVDQDGIGEILIAEDAGGLGRIGVYRKDGTLVNTFQPFGKTLAGLDVAIGDPDQDGAMEIISTRSQGFLSEVAVSSAQGVWERSFTAYGSAYRGGAWVAVGDVSGDRAADILTGTWAGGGPHVRAFSSSGNLVKQWFVGDPKSRKGVRVATGYTTGLKDAFVAVNGADLFVRLYSSSGEVSEQWRTAFARPFSVAAW